MRCSTARTRFAQFAIGSVMQFILQFAVALMEKGGWRRICISLPMGPWAIWIFQKKEKNHDASLNNAVKNLWSRRKNLGVVFILLKMKVIRWRDYPWLFIQCLPRPNPLTVGRKLFQFWGRRFPVINDVWKLSWWKFAFVPLYVAGLQWTLFGFLWFGTLGWSECLKKNSTVAKQKSLVLTMASGGLSTLKLQWNAIIFSVLY